MSETCQEQGLVTAQDGHRIHITVERGEACGSCQIKNACQTLGGQKQDLHLILDNPVNAQKGDVVKLSISQSAVVGASTVLYFIPAVGLILGAVLGSFIAQIQHWPSDPSAIIGCFLGLCLGLSTSFLLGKKLSQKKIFTPVVSSIAHAAPTTPAKTKDSQ